MSLKLEELRKRLLQPVPASPTSYLTLEPGRQVWLASAVFSQQPPTENSPEARHRSASAPEENPSARSEAEIVPLNASLGVYRCKVCFASHTRKDPQLRSHPSV